MSFCLMKYKSTCVSSSKDSDYNCPIMIEIYIYFLKSEESMLGVAVQTSEAKIRVVFVLAW